MDEAKPAELGKYRLIAELARGGMGVVYLAAVTGPGGFHKTLVVKELKPDLAKDEGFLGMFLDEARVAARLQHPNIVQTNEVGQDGDRYFIAMEYLQGCTFRRAAKELGAALTLGMQVHVIGEVLRGLDHAHQLADLEGKSLRLVHRDVNPHNVFLTFDGQVKLLDFGIAKTLDSSQLTEAGTFKGKVAYMAPEQASGDPPVDLRADIYACGVMLWEACAGRRLWGKKQDLHILTQLVRKEVPRLEEVKPDAPPALLRIVTRAMAYDRADRFATAAEFAAELERYAKATRAVGPREIGELLGKALEAERAKMKALVDRKLGQLKAGDLSTRVLISIAPPSSTSAVGRIDIETDPDEEIEVDDHATVPDPVESLPASPAAPEQGDALDAPLSRASETSGPTRTNAAVSAPIAADEDDGPALPVSRPYVRLAVGAVVAALAAAAYVGLRPDVRPASPARTEATRATAPAIPPAEPAAESVVLTIRVAAPGAQIALDQEPPVASPLVKRVLRGSGAHGLRVTAPGFQTKSQEITAERDMFVDLMMTPIAGRPNTPPPARPSPPPSPPQPPPATPAPSAGGNTRPIETSSPYVPGAH